MSDIWDGPHDFEEDINDASMCMCGIPALTHDLVYALMEEE